MQQTRRAFLGTMALPVVAAAVGVALDPLRMSRALAAADALDRAGVAPGAAALNEDFWFEVQQAFTVDRSIVNLNNGGVSPSPGVVQAAMERHLAFSNKAPVYTMWEVLEPQREGVRQRLARQFGIDPEEIALTRNASESLQTCQLGFDLARGDEVLTTTQDYPRMLTTFRQRERREGIVLKLIKIPTPAEDPAEVVRLFEEAITPRTRMILASHMVFLTGQALPVAEIAAMSRRRGVPVIVDGAHALAHLDFTIGALDVDYYSSSLHKWLFAPHGTGLLYVRKDKIKDLWPLMAAEEKQSADIRKFEEIGTHPAANYLAIGEALTFHQGIGPARKLARMVALRDRWAKRLLQHDRVRLHTSLKPGLAGGVATVEIDGAHPGELQQWLWKSRRIITVAILHDEFRGLRISPSVYTTLEEVDRFCDAVEYVLKNGMHA